MNQWIETYLRQFVNGRQDDWTTYLPVAEFAHNSWKHETSGHTPHQLIMGFNPSADWTEGDETVPATAARLEELDKARTIAHQSLQKKTQVTKPIRTFAVGDQVWLDARNIKIKAPSRKMSPRRIGPFTISQKVSSVAYRLDLPTHMNIHNVFHVDLISPYTETAEYGIPFKRPAPETIEGEEEYEVDEIIAERKHGRKRQRQYLVRWKGYPASDNSWVSKDDLHAPELLQEFYGKQQA
jgi:hypothetical protein